MLRRIVLIAGAGVIPLLVAHLTVNPKLNKIPAAARSNIELAALAYLIDMPAGTNVSVRLASFSPTTVTGSDYYPAKYGSYNFVLTQQNNG